MRPARLKLFPLGCGDGDSIRSRIVSAASAGLMIEFLIWFVATAGAWWALRKLEHWPLERGGGPNLFEVGVLVAALGAGFVVYYEFVPQIKSFAAAPVPSVRREDLFASIVVCIVGAVLLVAGRIRRNHH